VVIYGGDSFVGGAVARAFAREGARVFLAGRRIAELHALASELDAAGAGVDAAQVDALANFGAHADAVARRTGSIDACFNALGAERLGSVSLTGRSMQARRRAIAGYTKAEVLPAVAVARHMRRQGSGVILTLDGMLTRGSTCPHAPGSTRVELDGHAHDLAAALTSYGVRVHLRA
jgi:3-oxoacyl-[acyl-carrier protein] reductase